MLGDESIALRNIIVYWNEIHEWRVLEYDLKGAGRVVFESDTAQLAPGGADGMRTEVY